MQQVRTHGGGRGVRPNAYGTRTGGGGSATATRGGGGVGWSARRAWPKKTH